MNYKKSHGYLLEIPILLVMTAVLLAVFLPMIDNILVKKILLVIGVITGLFCSYYMIVISGWQPNQTRFPFILQLVKFIILAALVLFFTTHYLFS